MAIAAGQDTGRVGGKAKKENPTFSSAGNGSPGHFAAKIFGDAAGAKITHVPYKGNAPAVLAIPSGEVQAGILATPGMVQHVKAGKITPLAVTSRKRSLALPEVPTVTESRHKDMEFEVLQIAMLSHNPKQSVSTRPSQEADFQTLCPAGQGQLSDTAVSWKSRPRAADTSGVAAKALLLDWFGSWILP